MSESISSTQVEIGHAEAKTLVVIGSIASYFPSPSGPVTFSADCAAEVTQERAAATNELFVGDEQLIEDALAGLTKHHILLLAGERGSGTSTLAIHLANRVAERARLRNTLTVAPLDRNVRIDIGNLVAEEERLAGRVTIFTDVLGRHNHDLSGLFARNDTMRWEQLTTALQAKDAYLIFTTEPDAVFKYRRQNGNDIVCHEVPRLTSRLVGLGLDKRVSWLEKRQMCLEHIRELKHNRERLITVLKTLPRVARFIDQFVQGSADFEAALLRFNDVPFWFSTDLANDIDAWCFVLTLALAHAARPASDISWYEFERIRCAIAERIKSDAEFSHRRTEMSGRSLSDDAILLRGRAEFVKDTSRLGDGVRFIDNSYAAIIWETLAAHHRRVLAALLPVLRNIAEKERGAGSYGVRSLAAQMIGRIGELDPFSISIPLVQRQWVGANDLTQRPLVGRLVQGMRSSCNETYRRAALNTVDSLTVERPGESARNRDRLLTAISCYALLGEQELAMAMERLGSIATQRLAPAIASRHQIERLTDEFDERISKTDSPQHADDLLAHRLRLGRLADRLGEQHATTLLALKQAVVYLCLTNDCIQVLCAMHEWIEKGGKPAGTLVVLLFLHGGIAEELNSRPGGKQISPIVQSLATGAHAVEKFSAFLAGIYQSILRPDALPARLQRELQESFEAQLKQWEGAAAGKPVHREAVQALLRALKNTRGALCD